MRDDTVDALAARAEIEYFPAGTEILSQEGAPAEHLFVVRRGAVELLDEGELIDVLEEGESFGHSSLLAGLPPSFTARAREDTLCYLFPAELARSALSEAEGATLVAATLRSRLTHATRRTHRATPWGAAHVRDRAQPALVVSPDTSIREAARRMTDAGRSSIVVSSGDGLALVTDRDLRAQVIAGDLSPDDPVAAVRPGSAPAVGPDALALDALVQMLESDAEELLVVDDGELVGVVEQAALLELDGPSPFRLRQRILRAESVDAVAEAVADAPHLAIGLLDASVAALDVLDILTAMTDAATRRLCELAIADLGEPPCPWAWLTLGSAARREQTLATDQDNGLAYERPGDESERYFRAFAERMNDWLARCGYAECRAGVMARNAGWRLPLSGWLELYESWVRFPARRNVQLAMIGLDVRGGIGPLDVEPELGRFLEELPRHTEFLDALARAAVAGRPPLGFLRDFVVERSGQHVGRLDVKSGGVMLIVNLARLYALSAGSTATRTIDRLRAAAARSRISSETAQELEEAFGVVCRLRLEHQAAQVVRGAAPDNHIDPAELPPGERRELKEAFRAIARAQKAIDARPATRIR
jgi:CBS domain-containing protein